MAKQQTRRAREKQRHHDEIINAAEHVFVEKGFHGATMEEIATKAEFAVGTLYNFFDSKEALYRALVLLRSEQFHDDLVAYMQESDQPREIVRRYVEGVIELAYKYIPFMRLFARQQLNDHLVADKVFWETAGPLHDDVMIRLTKTFEAGMAQGCFRCDIDAADMTRALDSMIDGFMHKHKRMIDPEEAGLSEKTEPILRLFFEGVCFGTSS